MAGFLGRHLHQLDPKGRVSLPVRFRRGRESSSFVLVHVLPDCLSLFPDDEWMLLESEIREYARLQPDDRHQVLRITSNAVEVAPDKQGRILIPERMRRAIGLGTEAELVGAGNKIEIWEPGRLAAAMEGEYEKTFQQHMTKLFV